VVESIAPPFKQVSLATPMDAMLRDFTNAYGAGEDGVTAFTEYDIERWKQIVDDQGAA
jgi:hypothetical protein